MKILFWILVAGDTAALLLWIVLGLAAAGSAKTNPLSMIGFFAVPTLILIAAVILFLRGASPLSRGAAMILAAAPALILLYWKSVATVQLNNATDDKGNLAYFSEGPLRDLGAAIDSNNASAVKAIASKVDVNKRAFASMTPLAYALRQMKKTPKQHDVLAALLAAGANPNLVSQDLPLATALQQSAETGPEPVIMLLKAGANPNTKDPFGTPVFFQGSGRGVDPAVMGALLDHGADIKVTDNNKQSIAFYAANSGNWRAVLVLLDRGADYKSARTINGESFQQMAESYGRVYGDTAGVAEVLAYLKSH